MNNFHSILQFIYGYNKVSTSVVVCGKQCDEWKIKPHCGCGSFKQRCEKEVFLPVQPSL